MKTLIAFLLIGVAAVTTADDKDMYERFAETLIYADDFPNEEVHSLIAGAMASGDPEIAELVLDAIGVKAFIESLGEDMNALRVGGVKPMPDRELSRVPGLKDWLIARYREKHSEWDGDYSVLSAEPPAEGPVDLAQVLSQKPGWVHVPYALARGWPGDPDVRGVLLGDARLYRSVTLVSLLNQGGFTSLEADKERWEVLAAADGNRDWLLAAATGLALSRDTDVIPHLIDLAESDSMTRHAVIKSLGGYDAAELLPHGKRIKALVEAGETNPFGVPTSAGYYKLRSIVETMGSDQ